MAKLDFSSFCGLLSGVDKKALYDAVKPELQDYAEHRYGGLPVDQAYSLILEQTYKATGGEGEAPMVENPVERVRRMGKGRDGQGRNYDTARIHVERIYYFFLFSDAVNPLAYGDRISEALFGQSFFDKFAKQLRAMNVERPNYLPPSSQVKLGGVEISLGDDLNLLPFRLEWNERPRLLDDEGKPAVYAAMHWQSGLTELHGRVDEYNRIWNWALDGSKLVKTMLISGPGGAGKTRLAAEVVRNLVGRKKWKGGFLLDGYDKSPGVYDGNGAGVIFIIDYPEEKTEAVKHILAAAGNPVTYDKPIRIILVSRENKQSWLRISNKIESSRFEDTPLDLNRYVSEADAIEIASEVEDHYPHLISRPAREFVGVLEWLKRHETHRLPLNIVAASVHAVLDPSHAFKLDGAEILTALAEWELRRVRYYSERDLGNVDTLEKLLALSLLTEFGLNKKTVFDLGEKGICVGSSGDSLLESVRKTPYWQPEAVEYRSHLMRLEPDRPAAVFCLKALKLDDPSPGLPRLLIPAALQDADGLSNRLSRLAFDIGHIDSSASRSLENHCIMMLELQPELIHQFYAVAYAHSHIFSAAFAAEVCQRLLEVASDDEDKSLLLNSWANKLSDLGQWEAALRAIEKATAICHRLAKAQPEAFLPDLANSLNSQAVILSDLGQREAALKVIRKAIEIRCRLAKTQPDAFLSVLASSLNNQSNMLSDLGQWAGARQAIRKAVAICCLSAKTQPDTFLPQLASSLNNYANILYNLDRQEMALRASQKAVAIRRQLANTRPDAFLPDLASSLNNYANRLLCVNQTEAMKAIERAAAIRRKLAMEGSGAFRSEPVRPLNSQENRLSNIDQRETALEAVEEALAIYQRLAEARPDTFLPDLASSLHNRAVILSSLGQFETSLKVIGRAVAIRRLLSKTRRDAFLPELASSLNNRAIILSTLGRSEKALRAIEKAVAIRRQLANDQPNAFLPDLAGLLNNQAIILFNLDQQEWALSSSTEAITMLRPFFLEFPMAHRSSMKTFLKLHFKICNQNSLEPDMDFLQPVVDLISQK